MVQIWRFQHPEVKNNTREKTNKEVKPTQKFGWIPEENSINSTPQQQGWDLDYLNGTPSGSLGQTASRAANMAACPCSKSSSSLSRFTLQQLPTIYTSDCPYIPMPHIALGRKIVLPLPNGWLGGAYPYSSYLRLENLLEVVHFESSITLCSLQQIVPLYHCTQHDQVWTEIWKLPTYFVQHNPK